jgi:spermidine/putrescine transport system permease protein
MLFLFAPIFIIVIFSFNNPKGKFNLIWSGFTLKHWGEVLTGAKPNLHYYPELNHALIRSVVIGLSSSAIATVIGTLMAFALVRYRIKGTGIVSTILVLPLTTPEIVMGASLFAIFLNFSVSLGVINLSVTRGYATILIAHVMFCISYVTMTVKARMRGFDWALEDAALDLGATPRKAFWRVTLPLALPGIFAAFLLSFALSFDDFIITLFVAGDVETFPIRIFGQSRTSIPPQIDILSTILLLITTFCFVAPTVISIRKEKKLHQNRVIIP